MASAQQLMQRNKADGLESIPGDMGEDRARGMFITKWCYAMVVHKYPYSSGTNKGYVWNSIQQHKV